MGGVLIWVMTFLKKMLSAYVFGVITEGRVSLTNAKYYRNLHYRIGKYLIQAAVCLSMLIALLIAVLHWSKS